MAFVQFSLVPWSQDSKALEDRVVLGTIPSGKVLAGDVGALVMGGWAEERFDAVPGEISSFLPPRALNPQPSLLGLKEKSYHSGAESRSPSPRVRSLPRGQQDYQ